MQRLPSKGGIVSQISSKESQNEQQKHRVAIELHALHPMGRSLRIRDDSGGSQEDDCSSVGKFSALAMHALSLRRFGCWLQREHLAMAGFGKSPKASVNAAYKICDLAY